MKIKSPRTGEFEEVKRINIVKEDEKWNTYDLEDGTTLRAKLCATTAYRVKGKYDPRTGEPLYVVCYRVVVDSKVPDTLVAPETLIG